MLTQIPGPVTTVEKVYGVGNGMSVVGQFSPAIGYEYVHVALTTCISFDPGSNLSVLARRGNR